MTKQQIQERLEIVEQELLNASFRRDEAEYVYWMDERTSLGLMLAEWEGKNQIDP